MLRTLSAVAIGVTMLGMTALPAAAAPAAKPKVHNFTLPPVTGIKVWGSHYTASGKAHITLCAKETASNVDLVVAVATAFGATPSRHQSLEVLITRQSSKQVCKTLVTKDTAHLYAGATSGTTDGKAHEGKIKKIY